MRHTILVVDDQDDEREATMDLLRRHDFVVESACNGQEALARLREGGPLPALVALDLNMPVMDGWEFLVHASQDRRLRHLPVVVISGSPAVHEAVVVPRNVTFMAKPLRPEALLTTIDKMLPQEEPQSLSERQRRRSSFLSRG